MLLDYLKLGVDLTKGISWPLAVTVIAFTFRVQLRSLFPRMRRLGLQGAEFDIIEQQQSIALTAVQPTTELPQLPGMERSKLIADLERGIRDQVSVLDPNQREHVLIYHVARLQTEIHFARAYADIFGSQIKLLKILNERKVMSVDDARMFFTSVQQQFPDIHASRTYAEWSAYLKRWLFVEESESDVSISDAGREFLGYLWRYGLSENKPL